MSEQFEEALAEVRLDMMIRAKRDAVIEAIQSQQPVVDDSSA